MVVVVETHTVWAIRLIVSPGVSKAAAIFIVASNKLFRAASSGRLDDLEVLSCFTRPGTSTLTAVEPILKLDGWLGPKID